MARTCGPGRTDSGARRLGIFGGTEAMFHCGTMDRQRNNRCEPVVALLGHGRLSHSIHMRKKEELFSGWLRTCHSVRRG